MEEDGESLTPFWLQNATNLRRVDRYRHRVSSLFFNSGVLLILLLVTAVFFVAFVIPTTMSFSAQIFRPNTVKKSWDSVNLVLVLFALFLGFFSRNRNDDYSNFDNQYQHQSSSSSNSNVANVVSKSNPSTPNKWYEYSDRAVFSDPISTRSMGGLRRNGTSYPDLHLHEVTSPWVAGDDQWRFYDDHHVYYRRRSWKEADKQDIETKNIPVDTFVVSGQEQEASCAPPSPSSPPPPLSPPPPPPPPQRRAVKEKEKKLYRPPSSTPTLPPPSQPPPPPPPPPQWRAAKEKEKRMYRSIAHEAKTSENVRNDSEPLETLSPPAAAAPPQPAQHWGIDRKKRDGGNASKDNFLASFYHKKKKKRQRQRSVDNLDAFFNHHSQPPRPQSEAQPAPPSHSVFQNLFSSRKGKRRRIPSDPLPAPPVSPPPFTAARVSKPRMQIQAITNYNPPLPVNIRRINSVNENSSSGGSSPLFPIPPPPPPPPPFKATGWKFVVEGDYVSVQSNPSSRSGSPDPDDVETSSPGGNATSSSPLFCPSPDVDTKADNFIARFRAGLKLEKINSFNKKQGLRMSNLGPRPGPTQI